MPFPHRYAVASAAQSTGNARVWSAGLPSLDSAPPAEFGGPGDRWSPETFLVAAVADCLVHTFRAVAKTSGLAWTRIECQVEGTLDRVERVAQFTSFVAHVTLDVPPGGQLEEAERALIKAEHGCLIANSLKAPVRLEAVVTVNGKRELIAAAG